MKTERVASQAIIKKKGSRTRWQTFRDNFELTLLTLPAVIFFFIFSYLPMGGIIIAFKNYRYNLGILGSPWVGFKNFEFFFTSQDAWRVTRNTVLYSALFIVVGIISAVTVALLLYELTKRLHVKIYQTIMILPHFMSWVVVGFVSYIMLNPSLGVFNQILEFFGFSRVQWYARAEYWPFILTIVNIWNGVGMGSIVYYAGLMGIDKELFEAAEIDGANRLQQTWAISIPSLAPLMTILTLLAIGNLFRGDFGLFYQIPRNVGLLYRTTDIIDTYVYRGLAQIGNLGMTAAVGFYQSFVGLILIFVSNWLVRKYKPENSLF